MTVNNEQKTQKPTPTEEGRLRRLWRRVKVLLLAATNPRFLLCFGMGWIITNGWAYIMLGFGIYLGIGWMTAVGGGYLAFLWLPVTPEKIITVAIAIFLLKRLFPNDEKTLARLREFTQSAKEKAHDAKERHKEKREAHKEDREAHKEDRKAQREEQKAQKKERKHK